MPARLRSILRLPGARWYLLALSSTRSADILALVLLLFAGLQLSGATLAGIASGLYGLVFFFVAPWWSARIEHSALAVRWLWAGAALHAVSSLALAALCWTNGPAWALPALALACGLTLGPMGVLVRSAWAEDANRSTPQSSQAVHGAINGLVSALHVVGPALAGALAAEGLVSEGFVAVALLPLVGLWAGLKAGVVERIQRPFRSDRGSSRPAWGALSLGGLWFACVGTLTVALFAYGQQQGQESLGAWWLALMIGTSVLAGLAYAAQARAGQTLRLPLVAACLLQIPLVAGGLLGLDWLWWAGLVFAGCGDGLLYTGAYFWLDRVIRPSRRTKLYALMLSVTGVAMSVGYMAGGGAQLLGASGALILFGALSGLGMCLACLAPGGREAV